MLQEVALGSKAQRINAGADTRRIPAAEAICHRYYVADLERPDFAPAERNFDYVLFAEPTRAQALGWPAIAAGEHTLLHAPTGSGKTLAAFLWTLDRLFAETQPRPRERWLRVLYVSPLKALTYDVERNLRAPLAGIRRTAEREGTELPEVRVASRTGDSELASQLSSRVTRAVMPDFFFHERGDR